MNAWKCVWEHTFLKGNKLFSARILEISSFSAEAFLLFDQFASNYVFNSSLGLHAYSEVQNITVLHILYTK